jgi:protein-arginine kinase activator protein McsA
MKKCGTCGEVKPFSEFNKFSRARDKLFYHCRQCAHKKSSAYYRQEKEKDPLLNRKRNLRRMYGLSIEEYDAMVEEQNGLCAICKQEEKTIRQDAVQCLSVDHCHDTGKIRGLLCNNCNRALGKFKDSLTVLESACEYLKTHK